MSACPRCGIGLGPYARYCPACADGAVLTNEVGPRVVLPQDLKDLIDSIDGTSLSIPEILSKAAPLDIGYAIQSRPSKAISRVRRRTPVIRNILIGLTVLATAAVMVVGSRPGTPVRLPQWSGPTPMGQIPAWANLASTRILLSCFDQRSCLAVMSNPMQQAQSEILSDSRWSNPRGNPCWFRANGP